MWGIPGATWRRGLVGWVRRFRFGRGLLQRPLLRRRPVTDELVYRWHPNGFAMESMRSATVRRLYLRIDATNDIKNWSDDGIWSELNTRRAIDGAPLNQVPLISKGICPCAASS